MNDIMLDYVEQSVLPSVRQGNFENQLRYLGDVREGLRFLADHVSRIEAMVVARLPGSDRVCGWGNLPYLQGVPMPLLRCMFDWFAVAGCNYVRMVGHIRAATGALEKASEYLERTQPALLTFRDKVSAHLAGATRNRKDNSADRQHSVLPQVSWDGGKFRAGAWTLTTTSGSTGLSEQSAATSWSLTEVFADFGRRYWPHAAAN